MFEKIKEFASLVYKIGFTNAVKISSGNTKRIFLKNIKSSLFLRSGTSDIPTFKQIFVRHQYDVKLNLNPYFIIDGGANIGLSAIYFANKFPNATIVAVEPDKKNFEILKKNIKSYPNIHSIHSGLWDKAVTMNVTDKYKKGNWGMVTEEYKGSSAEVNGLVQSITIPDIISKFNYSKIDLLKLDIETSEKQLFSANYNDWLPITKVILIELHDHKISGCSKAFFTAINETFKTYSFSQSGENTVIVNDDLN